MNQNQIEGEIKSNNEIKSEVEPNNEVKDEVKANNEVINEIENNYDFEKPKRIKTQNQYPRRQLERTSSIESQNQCGPTCYAHATARCITKLIKAILPNQFKISDEEAELLKDNVNIAFSNLGKVYSEYAINRDSFEEAMNYLKSLGRIEDISIGQLTNPQFLNYFKGNKEEVIKASKKFRASIDCVILSESKYKQNIDEQLINPCKIKGRENYLLLFYYLITNIKIHFSHDHNPGRIMQTFLLTPKNLLPELYSTFFTIKSRTIPLEYQSNIPAPIRAKVQDIYDKYITQSSNYNITVSQELINKKSQTIESNFINNFPELAKKAIDSGLYVSMGFWLNAELWEEFKEDPYSETYTPEVIENIKTSHRHEYGTAHALVITNYTPDTITILNSWGTKWGDEGTITVNSNSFLKFFGIYKDISDEDNDTPEVIQKTEVFDNNKVGNTIHLDWFNIEPKKGFFSTIFKRKGGTRKTKKNKTRKNKTRKNKKNKKIKKTKKNNLK